MKKIITAAVLIALTMAMTVTSFAGSAITSKKALKIALKDAGMKKSQVYAVDSEYDEGKYDVEFKTKKAKTEFDYEISKKGRILEKSVDYRYEKNHSKEKIGKAAARKAVSKFSGISLKTVKKGTCVYDYDDDDREGTYEVKFKKGNYRYDFDVLAPTGEIIEYSKKYRK